MTVLGLEGPRVAVAGWVDRHPAGRFAAFLLRELSQDDVTGLAVQMAYGFLFAAFPLLLFLVTALGFVGDALGVDHLVEQLLERGNLFLPAQASSVVDRYTGDLLTTRSPVLPNPHHRYVWSLPGSAVAATGWLLLTRGFGLYVENFGHFDAVYGSFGAVIVFSFWLYLVGLVALVGAEVNAHLEPGQRQNWAGPRLLPAAPEECGCGDLLTSTTRPS